MKISLIQFPIVPGDRLANFDQVRRRVQQAARAGSDMAVLPELWDLSFYPPDVYDLADEEGRQAQEFLQDLASSCHIQLIGGSAVTTGACTIRRISSMKRGIAFRRMTNAIYLRLAGKKRSSRRETI